MEDNKSTYGPAPPRERIRSPEQDRRDVPQNADDGACRQCGSEVPSSAATHEEGQDYMRHFCGPPCYEQWQKNVARDIPAPAPQGGKVTGPEPHGD